MTAPRLRSVGRRVTPERLQRIADVALTIAVESGFAAVTMQTVAKRAEYVRPVVYDCYGTPENLLLTVLDRERTLLTAELTEAAAARGGAGRLLSYLRVQVAHPRSWRLFTLPTEGAEESVRAAVSEFRELLRRDIEDWVTDVTADRPGPVDAEALSVLVLAAIDAIGARMVSDPQAYGDARIETFVRSLEGLLRPAPSGAGRS
ncbi:TetR/AcrR family transcriptional regulator [Nocardia sp. NPDC004340]